MGPSLLTEIERRLDELSTEEKLGLIDRLLDSLRAHASPGMMTPRGVPVDQAIVVDAQGQVWTADDILQQQG